MTSRKDPASTDTTDTVQSTDVAAASEQWGEPDTKTGAKYRSVPWGKQVRVYVLTSTGRSANLLADSEDAGRKALAGFVAEHTPVQ